MATRKCTCHCVECTLGVVLETVQDLKTQLNRMEKQQMSANDVLVAVRDSLAEASSEIVAKLEALSTQLAEQGADPALLAEVSSLATGLANIVPNAVDEDPDVDPLPELEPEPTPEPEDDAEDSDV